MIYSKAGQKGSQLWIYILGQNGGNISAFIAGGGEDDDLFSVMEFIPKTLRFNSL